MSSYSKSVAKQCSHIAVPPNPADQEGIKSTENTNSNPYDRTLVWVDGYIKPNSCNVCEEGGDVVWIRSEYGWEKAYCIKCGRMQHTLFMCMLNCCEWHEHCEDCGSELCMCCFDGMCYVCNRDDDGEQQKSIFSSQAEAQQTTMFGSRYIDTW